MPPAVRSFASLYDSGSLIRAVFQLITVAFIVGGSYVAMDSRINSNEKWLVKVQQQADSQAQILNTLPALNLAVSNFQKSVDRMDTRLFEQHSLSETVAALEAQIKILSSQVDRLEAVIYRSRADDGKVSRGGGP